MKKIPLGPTLVVIVGPSGAGKSTFVQKHFSPEEVVSSDGLRSEFCGGDFRRMDMNNVVFREMDRRICNRLEAGLRVVVDSTNINDSPRRHVVKLAEKYSANVVYLVVNRSLAAKLNSAGWREKVKMADTGKSLIAAHDETFLANESKILNGDGVVKTVIDTRKDQFEVVYPLSRENVFADITSRGYEGILIVSDIHGNLSGLDKMNKLADDKNFFIIYLGDIVDYGVNTLRVADIVADRIFSGKAVSIFGNHERKILKWVTQNRIDGIFECPGGFSGNLSEGNNITVNQLKALSEKDRYQWETRFIGMCATMPHFIQMDRWMFIHGACKDYMWGSDEFRFSPDSTAESYAIFGETDGTLVNGFPNRLYNWVNDIPARHTVVVGHDIRSDVAPFVDIGENGGKAIFLDTGSSKPDRYSNAHLSALSLRIDYKPKKKLYNLEDLTFYSEIDL